MPFRELTRLGGLPAACHCCCMDWLLPNYHRIERRLRRILGRLGRSREDSEDLIQEALLRLHQYCRTAEVRDDEAFLARTVRNLSIDRNRREHKHLYVRESVEEIEELGVLVDQAQRPDEIFSAQDRLHRIKKMLDAVSVRTRKIYFAHRAGYSYTEIGASLHVSKSTIEKHIARAVLALMEAKEPE